MRSHDRILFYYIFEKLSCRHGCPHCGSQNIVHYGTYNGKRRYKCKDCGKTFGNFTGTPFSGTHYSDKQWKTYLECMLKGMTLKASEQKTKVSYVTLFYWRHKILNALKQISKPKEMTGVIEIDHVYLNYSRKGQKNYIAQERESHQKSLCYFNIGRSKKVCVINAADRFRSVYSKKACIGIPHTVDIESSVGSFIKKGSTICINRNIPYKLFKIRKHLKECRGMLKGTRIVRTYIISCGNWMERFKGVATKYLDNYLSWHEFLHDIEFDESDKGVKRFVQELSKSTMYIKKHGLESLSMQ